MRKKSVYIFSFFILCGFSGAWGKNLFELDNLSLVYRDGETVRIFEPEFTVVYNHNNPNLSAKASGIPGVQYNVEVWDSSDSLNILQAVERNDDQFGDGFDDNILNRNKKKYTANLYSAGINKVYKAVKVEVIDKKIIYGFEKDELGALTATIDLTGNYPVLNYVFVPDRNGYFSIGYTGAPACKTDEADEIWQPLIWQEKRVPNLPYLTLAYRCPLPATLFTKNNVTVGVVANDNEYPFNPLPVMSNSRFGVSLINKNGEVQPQIFAPVLGGKNSRMKKGENFSFSAVLYVREGNCSVNFEKISREIYGFSDYRKNTGNTLNATLDNMIDYGMSRYSMFIDSLKGCNYSTDAPGAVKNVSSLNPLQISLLTGREDIYDKRAYPMIEYMLSRDKFLFTVDPKQKIQYPSRELTGPVAPISELSALYLITHKTNSFLVDLAQKEYNSGRIRNLNKFEPGDHWRNALAIYRMTNDSLWLNKAVSGADRYLKERVRTPQTDFSEKNAEFFFWTGFTPDWVSLFQLYEATKENRYLEAAYKGIRQYALFVWLSPRIPEGETTVNESGFAPHYAYLKGKGYPKMAATPETVENWRLSEIGLTAESSGTSTGHRGIFMTNYAPWILRIGFLMHDKWLQDIAKSAIIGRYANFPGYHINTARTTIYEKEDYPYREYNELSVNSFHYNHIWPHTNILTDYLVTDAYVKSEGKIEFPSLLVEGFAYLQSKFYGFEKGTIYNYKNVNLYMPQRLIKPDSRNEQLNSISGYNEDFFIIAFTNQSNQQQTASVELNDSLFYNLKDCKQYEIWQDNKLIGQKNYGSGYSFTVNPSGISVLAIKGLRPKVASKGEPESQAAVWEKNYAEDTGNDVVAMVWHNADRLNTLFTYVKKNNPESKSAILNYSFDGIKWTEIHKRQYPYEFSLPIESGIKKALLRIDLVMDDDTVKTGKLMELTDY